jgi:hypothetical protein
MSKLDQLRALRGVRGSRGSPENLDQDVARQHEHRTGGVRNDPGRPRGERAPVTSPAREKPKLGRPLDVDKAKTLTAIKPWAAAGLSRRTWYRRRAEKGVQ